MDSPVAGSTPPTYDELQRRLRETEAALAAVDGERQRREDSSGAHRRTQAQLSEKDARLRSIFLAAPIGVGLVLDRVLLEVSDALCRLVGYSRAELVGQSSRILYPTEEDFAFVGREKYRQITAAGVGTVETRFRHKDGAVVNVILSSAPLDPSDPGKGITFTALDITERIRAEEERRQAELRYREVFNATSEAIFIDDAHTGRMLDVNDAVLRMYGYASRDEVLAGNIGDLSADQPPFTEEEAQRRIRAAVAGTPQQFEWLARRKDGSVFPVEVTLRSFTIGGQDRVLAVVRDVSERKRAEEELASHLDELQRWHDLFLGRENRVIELKREINDLLARSGETPRYPSVIGDATAPPGDQE